ncbi:DUF928 domain-containing protein [Lusitaniella coriacea LEGE 07157]|uniref:DUF928 domain-containing protein n=1 Tax=Lusitaniella coriacea LEGE 07157 TaxID=945747 RepID=A0A8J7DYW4_9CYAN|nr:DUF928 domain-containing protein [Lusitaniella coriacea]MBE9118086.1 DUF928 domain-containing protein [Lusitaniella coriacea LEGE 07157]
MKRIFQLTQFTCILAWVAFGLPPIQLKPLHSQLHSSSEQATSLSDPPSTGIPNNGNTGGNGSRGCSDPLLALVKNQSGERMGFTRQERPTFWVYLPYEQEQLAGGKLKFSLRSLHNGEEKNQYEQKIEIHGKTPGVIGITLPPDAPALDPEQEYKWYVFVDVYCPDDPYATPEKETVSALVIRKEVSANVASEEDFVYDRLSEIAQSENPEERQQQWLQFLQSLNLEQNRETLADKCCTILNPSTPISYQ